jgi:sterol desaturase/sphingolipid hydroxylase (fatty acid hydroxylase superfamily)
MFKKILLYLFVYVVITFLMSYDEVQCAFNGEDLCWVSLIAKFVIFIVLVFIFDRFIKPKIFKR